MTGKTIIFDINSLLHEFCYISGNEEEIYSFLAYHLNTDYFKHNIRLIKVSDFQDKKGFNQFLKWLNSLDKCIELFNLFDFPKKFKKFINIESDLKFAIPIRKILSDKKIQSFIVTANAEIDFLNKLQVLAVLSGYKIDSFDVIMKMNKFFHFYNFGQISKEVLHEVKNKLIAPSTFIQLFPSKYEDKKFRDEFGSLALNELNSIQTQIENVMNHSAKSNLKEDTIPISFNENLEYCLGLLNFDFKKYKIKCIKKIHKKIIIPMSNQDLRDILFNLILNSIHALRKKKSSKKISIQTIMKNDKIGFSIEDTGVGINQNELKKLFYPFYTTKVDGTGLGLNIVKRLIDSSNGEIIIQSKKNIGTKFLIIF